MAVPKGGGQIWGHPAVWCSCGGQPLGLRHPAFTKNMCPQQATSGHAPGNHHSNLEQDTLDAWPRVPGMLGVPPPSCVQSKRLEPHSTLSEPLSQAVTWERAKKRSFSRMRRGVRVWLLTLLLEPLCPMQFQSCWRPGATRGPLRRHLAAIPCPVAPMDLLKTTCLPPRPAPPERPPCQKEWTRKKGEKQGQSPWSMSWAQFHWLQSGGEVNHPDSLLHSPPRPEGDTKPDQVPSPSLT